MRHSEKEAVIDLAADPASSPAARRFLAARLADWGCDGKFDVAPLLTSEVVTNAVLHAESPVRLRVALESDETLRVEVRDRSQEEPIVRRVGPTSTTGRGMYLVSMLASRWGVQRDDRGKVVWFEVQR